MTVRRVRVQEPLPEGMTDAQIQARVGDPEHGIEGGCVIAARASKDRRLIYMTVEYDR